RHTILVSDWSSDVCSSDLVREVADETLPDGVTGQFQGAAKAFQGALSNLAVLLVIAVMVVYIVLGILYESYIHPLTILSGLPSRSEERRVGKRGEIWAVYA